jgi:hypothetical protein
MLKEPSMKIKIGWKMQPLPLREPLGGCFAMEDEVAQKQSEFEREGDRTLQNHLCKWECHGV